MVHPTGPHPRCRSGGLEGEGEAPGVLSGHPPVLPGVGGARVPARLPGAKQAIPEAAQRCEGVVAALVALVVPVVVVGHLVVHGGCAGVQGDVPTWAKGSQRCTLCTRLKRQLTPECFSRDSQTRRPRESQNMPWSSGISTCGWLCSCAKRKL